MVGVKVTAVVSISTYGSILCCVDVIHDDLIESNHPICLREVLPSDVDLCGT